MMLVAKSDIKAVYSYLLNEGVIVVKKDPRLPKHPDVAVSNLVAMNVMKSMKSRGYVTEEFNWQYYYFYLTDEGILFLRNYLHMPETVVPATLAKTNRRGRSDAEESGEGERRPRRHEEGDIRRGGWRGRAQQQEQSTTA